MTLRRPARHWQRRVALALLVAWPLARAAAAPLRITDDRGVDVELAAPPRRIVSLLPSLTESLCALGACDRLVGVDRYATWPPAVRALPRLGGGLDPDIEAVTRLQPDLVLLAQSSRAIDRLEALGLPVAVLEPRTHADVRRVLARLDALLGSHEAARVWRDIDAELQAEAQGLPPAVRGTRVYFEVNTGPYAAGASSFIGETLARLGVRNIVPATLGVFPKLNPEFVVRADPQVIMIGDRSAEGLARRPGWSSIDAVRTGRICRFTPAQIDVLVRAGPRLAEGARLMARCLAP